MASAPSLYRVQHDRSFTIFDEDEGFEANGHYAMEYSHWFNRDKVLKHLDWHDRSEHPSPFISLFDNLEKAQTRKRFHEGKGETGVFITRIDTSKFEPICIPIEFLQSNGIVREVMIRGWGHRATRVKVFSMKEIACHFNIQDFERVEWLALNAIPSSLVIRM